MSAIYRGIIGFSDKFVPKALRPIWEHPAGPKTVFFWSPVFKWGLVIAGIGDLTRPAEKLSTAQSGALAATGIIWSRYSLVIIPKNWALFSVNLFVAFTGCYQLARIYRYKASLKSTPEKPILEATEVPKNVQPTSSAQGSKTEIKPKV
ncbi:mitochondrial pyruvate carrier 2-like protein [Leptotrombidium deliense]|uniref:Mitochondrial pyruvate carrier n=1 Tax=Leptotrombidium deliense TaxID=299467 RepID=A0A443SRQ7_9ACAR|nr:mitochondrial pyruvate carrier 2-like protein [Leptotrombidium deliense]